MSDVAYDGFHARLVARLPGMIWASAIAPDGTFRWLHLSDPLLELFALDREAVMQNAVAFNDRIHPEDRAAYDTAKASAAAGDASYTWQGRIVRPDGDVRWLELEVRVDRDPVLGTLWFGQTFDRTDEEKAHRALADAERARRESERTLRSVIDHLPVGVSVFDATGTYVLHNEAMLHMIDLGAGNAPDERAFRGDLFELDGVTPIPSDALPLERALAGEGVLEREIVVRNALLPEGAVLSISSIPLRRDDGTIWAALAVCHDVTRTRRLELEVRQRNAELVASEEAKSALIERLRYAVDELSTPVLEVEDAVLVVPLIGVIDSRRMADLVQKLLAEVARSAAHSVILDLTGVDLVDTKTADHLIKLVRKVELVGAACVLTGIQPSVAQTLVDLGVDFGRLTTLRSLKHGLRASLQRSRGLGVRAAPEDHALDDRDAGARARP
jgi:rsbT co-antagonist protein RsbR